MARGDGQRLVQNTMGLTPMQRLKKDIASMSPKQVRDLDRSAAARGRQLKRAPRGYVDDNNMAAELAAEERDYYS